MLWSQISIWGHLGPEKRALVLSSYPAGAAAGSYIASVSSSSSSSYPAGAAAGSYIASVSSSSSFFFFFFFLSTSLFLLQLTWYDHVTQVYS